MQGDADDALIDAMLVASRALVAVAARSVASVPGDVTLPQFRALVILFERGPQSPSVLAEELATAPSSVTRLSGRLERKGLITRRHVHRDRRQVRLELTEEGADLVRHVTEERRRRIIDLIAVIPQAQRADLVSALVRLGRAADVSPEPSWSSGWTEAP